MTDGLDLVRTKVESLTRKVRKNQLPTGEGIGYLEAKHHLLLGYCQDLVYYLLRKAKGLSVVDGHPVVRSLVEIRLFLEKIRPIDKKMEYQIQKLTNAADGAAAQDKVPGAEVNVKGRQQGDDDLLGYRPNPDMMDIKIVSEGQVWGIYFHLQRPCRVYSSVVNATRRKTSALVACSGVVQPSWANDHAVYEGKLPSDMTAPSSGKNKFHRRSETRPNWARDSLTTF